MIPGEILFADDPVPFNTGREVTRLSVLQRRRPPVRVGSHYHFAEANPGLRFDRAAARGRSGVQASPRAPSVRFKPGIPVEIELVPLTGARIVPGLRGETGGALDARDLPRRLRRPVQPHHRDRIRLADTDLLIEIEEDRSGGPGGAGDEAVFGGGKVIRESMGQSRHPRRRHPRHRDHRCRRHRPLGHRQGRRRHPRRPHHRPRQGRQPGHHGRRPPGPRHRPRDRDHRGQRPHPHSQAPSTRTSTSSAPRSPTRRWPPASPPWSAAAPAPPRAPRPPPSPPAPGTWPDAGGGRSHPVNVGLLGKGNTVSHEAMLSQVRGGAVGLKLHEDWGSHRPSSTPRSPSPTAPASRSPPHRHPERGGLRRRHPRRDRGPGHPLTTTPRAPAAPPPDIMTVVSQPNVLPSSTNPTRPFTVNTTEEHLDMLMVCHHLSPACPRGPRLRRVPDPAPPPSARRILTPRPYSARSSIISSDSQAMGPGRRGDPCAPIGRPRT